MGNKGMVRDLYKSDGFKIFFKTIFKKSHGCTVRFPLVSIIPKSTNKPHKKGRQTIHF